MKKLSATSGIKAKGIVFVSQFSAKFLEKKLMGWIIWLKRFYNITYSIKMFLQTNFVQQQSKMFSILIPEAHFST